MSIINNIKKLFKKNDEKEIVKQLAESYQEKKENGEEHPVDSTISQIMNIINESDNPNATAQRILTAALEDKAMPDRISEKLSIVISKNPDISDQVITNAVEKSNIQVPDELIDTIIKEGEVTGSERVRLIKNVEDEEIIHRRIRNEFLLLYKSCKHKRDDEVASRIQELKDIIEKSNVDMDTQDLIENVISKKMAENIYDDIKKGTRIYNLSKAIPSSKMFERNITSKVEEEFKIIEQERGEKEGRFNKQQLEEQILMEMARTVGYKYRVSKKFIISQSQKLREISKDSEDNFIKKVESTSGKVLTDDDITEIKDQIRGTIRNQETKENILLDTIRELPNKEKCIDMITNILNDEQKVRTLTMIEETGLLQKLTEIPSETRRKTVQLIDESIKNRKEQIKNVQDKENAMNINDIPIANKQDDNYEEKEL